MNEQFSPPMSGSDQGFTNSIIQSFMDPVMLLDLSFCITTWNYMCEAMHGQSAYAVMGKPFFSVFPMAASIPIISQALQRAAKGYSSFVAAEEGGYTAGYFDNHFAPLKNEAGTIIGIMHVRHDIAHRVKAMNEMRLLNKKLERQNAELTDLTSTLQNTCKVIGRNLYEPLNRIYSFVNMLLTSDEMNLTPNGRQYFKRIRNLVKKSKDFSSDILTYITLDSEVEIFTEIDLNQVFKFINNTLKEQLSAAGATLRWHNLPHVKGNRRLLYQLFLELVRNALKFRGTEPLCVEVNGGLKHVELLSENKPEVVSYAWVSVADNGVGIRPRVSANLFQLFYKDPEHKDHDGNGLGLAICKKIIEKHKGTITATSNRGAGSIFNCILPVFAH